MSWTSKAVRRHLTGEQCETFDECIERLRTAAGDPPPSPAIRIAQLEDDLARAVLLIHSLTEACVQKGIFTREEIAKTAAEIDMFDGIADGKLDPKVVRPGEFS
jgi:hypothetical protein